MADRYWTVGHTMGYAGTKSEYTVDVCKLWGWDEEQVAAATNDEVKAQLHQDQYDQACEKVDAWALPKK